MRTVDRIARIIQTDTSFTASGVAAAIMAEFVLIPRELEGLARFVQVELALGEGC